MNMFWALAVFASLVAGSASTRGPLDENAVIRSNSFRLAQSQSNHCVIVNRKTGRKIQSGLRAPCHFLRRGGVVQSYRYTGIGTAFYIVAAPSPIAAFANYPSIKIDDECSESAQAVIISKSGGLTLRPPQQGGIYCHRMGLDEKDFHAAAHKIGL